MEPPSSATVKIDASKQQPERAPTPATASAVGGQKKEGSAKPAEEETRKEPTPSVSTTPVAQQQVTTTKSGRASKPSTPAIGSFPEPPPKNNGNSRSRPSRSSETPTIPKRSHKKGASAAHAAAVQKALAQQQKAGEDTGSLQEDEMDVDDPNEPRYCYCNRVSFGEMVGCDGEDCKIEWFHLECVGLRSAPKNRKCRCPLLLHTLEGPFTDAFNFSVKWYCDDCKRQVNNTGKKVNGR